MNWIDNAVRNLCSDIPCGYARGGTAQSEPTALAALALLANIQHSKKNQSDVEPQILASSSRARDWLAKQQTENGSVRLNDKSPELGWTTPLAVLVECSACALGISNATEPKQTHLNLNRAAEWIISTRGKTTPHDSHVAHNVELVGWPWIVGTHTWLEPTCLSVLALKAHGMFDHPRTREGVTVIYDRLLPSGGCNYGNTIVLGQELRPHLEPTGLALMALAGESDAKGLVANSVEWLRGAIGAETAAASLSYALLGLLAHGIVPRFAMDWLKLAHDRVERKGNSPHKLALLAWTGTQLESGETSPWPGLSVTLQPAAKK